MVKNRSSKIAGILLVGLVVSCSQINPNTAITKNNTSQFNPKYLIKGIAQFPESELTPKSPLSKREGTVVDGTLKREEKVNLSKSFSPSPVTRHPSLSFSTKATLTDVSTNAMVSLIYPPDHATNPNKTIATGLSEANGAFQISGSIEISQNDIFVLEASKRIGSVGNKVMSVRTYIKWNGSGWDSMTTPGIFILRRWVLLQEIIVQL